VRVLMCGDRNWSNIEALLDKFKELALPPDTVVIHGGAKGADQMAGYVAKKLGLTVEVFEADWARYGRAAGPVRNKAMLDSGVQLVVAFHEDISSSKGTVDMMSRAIKAGIKTVLVDGKEQK
jgi:hypothetical protein